VSEVSAKGFEEEVAHPPIRTHPRTTVIIYLMIFLLEIGAKLTERGAKKQRITS